MTTVARQSKTKIPTSRADVEYFEVPTDHADAVEQLLDTINATGDPTAAARTALDAVKPTIITADTIAALDDAPPPPVAYWKPSTLPPAMVMLVQPLGERIDVLYDPAQIGLDRARQALGIYHEYRETADSVSPAAGAAAGRTWTVHIEGGGRVDGYLPSWATRTTVTDEPFVPQLAADSVEALADIDHWTIGQGVRLPHTIDHADKPITVEMFTPTVLVSPFSDDEARQVPVVDIEVTPDVLMASLDPARLAEVIAVLRAHCDRLDRVRADLMAARADWEVNGR
ncbi:hypothetical protein [Streptomyces sp. NPDC049881]|uniref:DUF6907 domain-containing protein n=1 Tax=Streptomyces sp. NPDC049881 TaxID=3155778 RepID=UPI00341D3E93